MKSILTNVIHEIEQNEIGSPLQGCGISTHPPTQGCASLALGFHGSPLQGWRQPIFTQIGVITFIHSSERA
jgi:hypothetical protein